MTSPRLSVIVPTYRLGGIDCLKWSLDHQDYPHDRLQLVLVDALYSLRAEAVRDYFSGAKYDVVHCPPAQLAGEQPVGFRDMCPRYRNTGIQRAIGDILVFWSDFTLCLPPMLSLHVHRLIGLQRPCVVCGTHLYARLLPQMLRENVSWPQDGIDAYERDLAAMEPDDPRWISIFAFTPERIFAAASQLVDAHPTDLDPKLRLPNATVILPAFAHWKNESLTREMAEKVAGFDEFYNDTHCADDLDFAYRVQSATGCVFVLDKAIEVLIANPRSISPLLRRQRSAEETLKEWEFQRAKEIDAGAVMPRSSILLP